jgi:hypothetical protein
VVDDFGIKYVGKDHADHLHQVLQMNYNVTTDWQGSKFLGRTLDWDYENDHIDISMPDYVNKALQRFQHQAPRRPKHAPSPYTEPQYGAPIKFTEPVDETEALNKTETRTLCEVIGTFLYYARAINNTMLVALGSLGAAHAHGTQTTAQACKAATNS